MTQTGRNRGTDADDDYDMEGDDGQAIVPYVPAAGGQAPMAAAAAGGTSTRGPTGHGETDLSPVSFEFTNPFLPTVNAILPYRATGSLAIDYNAVAIGGRYKVLHYRLNSIYDVQSTTAYETNAVADADAADGTINTPMFRAYWAEKYRYWTVTSVDVEVRLRSTAAAADTLDEYYIYIHGLQQPIETNIAATEIVPFDYRRHHPNLWKHGICPAMPTVAANGYNQAGSYYSQPTVFKATIKMGQVKHEVMEDELTQVWHKVTEVPPSPETLTILVQPHQKSAFDEGTAVRYEVLLTYHAQFKDLTQNYQYICQDSAVAAIAAYPAQAN